MQLSGAEELLEVLGALVRIDERQLRRDPRIPDIYKSGVRYQREEREKNEWLTVLGALKRGVADCEDLAAWLCAQRRVQGDRNAKVVLKHVRRGLWHVLVQRGNGAIEDPSAMLGMRGPG